MFERFASRRRPSRSVNCVSLIRSWFERNSVVSSARTSRVRDVSSTNTLASRLVTRCASSGVRSRYEMTKLSRRGPPPSAGANDSGTVTGWMRRRSLVVAASSVSPAAWSCSSLTTRASTDWLRSCCEIVRTRSSRSSGAVLARSGETVGAATPITARERYSRGK